MPVSDVSLDLTNMLNALKTDMTSKKYGTASAADLAFNPYGEAGSPESQIQGLLEDTSVPAVAPPTSEVVTPPIDEGLIEPTPVVAPQQTPTPIELPTVKDVTKVVEPTEATKAKEGVKPTSTEATYGPSKKMEDFKSTEDYLKNANSETALVAGQLYDDMKKIDPEMAKKTLAILKDYGSFTGYGDIKKARTEYAKTLEAYPKEMEELSKQADTLRAKRPEYNWFLLAAAAIAGGRGGAAFINSYYKAVNDRFATDKEREAGVLSDKIKALEYKVQSKGTLLKLTTDQMADDVSMIKFLGGQFVRAKDALLLSKTNAISEVFLQESKQSVENLKIFTDSELKKIFTTKYGVTEAQLPTVLEAYYAYREQHRGVDLVTNEVAGRRSLKRSKDLAVFNANLQIQKQKELWDLAQSYQSGNNVTGGINSKILTDIITKKTLQVAGVENGMGGASNTVNLINAFGSKFGPDALKKLPDILGKIGNVNEYTDLTSIVANTFGTPLDKTTSGGVLGISTTTSNSRQSQKMANALKEIILSVGREQSLKPKMVANEISTNLRFASNGIYNQLATVGAIPKEYDQNQIDQFGGLIVGLAAKNRIRDVTDLTAISMILTQPDTLNKITTATASGTTPIEKAKLAFNASTNLITNIQNDPVKWNLQKEKAAQYLTGSGTKGKLTKNDVATQLLTNFVTINTLISGKAAILDSFKAQLDSAILPNSPAITKTILDKGYELAFNQGLMDSYITIPLSSYFLNPSD